MTNSMENNNQGQPVQGQPVQGQPVQGQPVQGQPVQGQPVQGQPVQGQAVQGQAMYQQPVEGQAMYQQPVEGQAMYQQPVQGQPMYQQAPVKKKRTGIYILLLLVIAAAAYFYFNGKDEPMEESLVEEQEEQEEIIEEKIVDGYLVVGDYIGIEIEGVELTEVTDSYIEEYIEYALSESTSLEVVNRAARDGDFVNIDYVGRINGTEFEGGSADGFDLELGSGTFIEGFEDQLIGAKAGSRVTVYVTFPTEYATEYLAGKEVEFEVFVTYVKELKGATLTDSWVKTVSYDSETVEEYREEVELMLIEDAESAYIEAIKSAAWTKLIDNFSISEYPEDEIEAMREKIELSVLAQAEQYGMELEEFVAGTDMDMDSFETYLKESAENEFLMKSVVNYIVNEEDLRPSDEEIEEMIMDLVTTAGFSDLESVEEAGYAYEDLVLNVLTEIVVEFVAENAIIIE